MIWRALSPGSQALVREIGAASAAWVGRTRRLVGALGALGDSGEPAAIPYIASRFLDTEPVVAGAAVAAVESLRSRLPPALLPALDVAMRQEGWGSGGPFWPRVVPADLARVPRGVTVPALPLGLLSMHPSGHVRQAALAGLDAMEDAGGGGLIPFLLLRLDDWVPAVRRQAEAAVAHRLTPEDRAAYRSHLGLLGRLRNRLRAGESETLARVEALLGEDLPALLAACLHASTSSTRRYGREIVWRAATAPGRPPATVQTVVRAMLAGGTTDPAARLFAARRVLADLGPGPEGVVTSTWAEPLLPSLLGDRSAAVRRLALAWTAEREGTRHLPALRAALLDPSPPARALAQFHVPRLEPGGMDLRGFYRAEVERRAGGVTDGSGGRGLRAAVAGLGECGARGEDDVLVLPFARPGVPAGVRRVALAALARLGVGARHLDLFWEAMQEPATGVSRQARRALEPLAPELGTARLGALLRETLSPNVRLSAILLVARLPKWAALPLLIEAADRREDDASRDLAARLLSGWLEAYNRSYAVRPAPAAVSRAGEALAQRGPGLDPRVRRELEGLVASLRG